MSGHKEEKKLGVYSMASEKTEYPEGIKWTKQRKAVYRILQNAEEPLSAARIYALVERECPGEEYAVSTIYRILAAFEEKNLVEKDADMEDGSIYYSLTTGDHRHYAVCLECHRRIPLQTCPFSHMHFHGETEEFTITSHKLELYGYCKECRNAEKTGIKSE